MPRDHAIAITRETTPAMWVALRRLPVSAQRMPARCGRRPAATREHVEGAEDDVDHRQPPDHGLDRERDARDVGDPNIPNPRTSETGSGEGDPYLGGTAREESLEARDAPNSQSVMLWIVIPWRRATSACPNSCSRIDTANATAEIVPSPDTRGESPGSASGKMVWSNCQPNSNRTTSSVGADGDSRDAAEWDRGLHDPSLAGVRGSCRQSGYFSKLKPSWRSSSAAAGAQGERRGRRGGGRMVLEGGPLGEPIGALVGLVPGVTAYERRPHPRMTTELANHALQSSRFATGCLAAVRQPRRCQPSSHPWEIALAR